ncbi:MAG: preprotein translocase subunit SecE [Oscillospiraceae bacterium]|nr:preprotein translocase subunit SecE [Oscillospiraceae bacterium]
MAEEKKVQGAPAKAVTAVKKDDSKPGFFKRVGKWFREMKSELNKVVWPTPKTLAKNSVVSVVFMLVSALVLWGADMIASLAVNLLFRIAG